jgi:hypothetical protein
MFLACRSRCGHCDFALSQGGDAPYLVKIHRCRTVLAFCQSIKSAYRLSIVEISGKHAPGPAGSMCNPLGLKITSSITTSESFQFYRIYKACCCDERCEFVESPLTSTTSVCSLSAAPAQTLWEPRKFSLIPPVLCRGTLIYARPSTTTPQLTQRFSINRILLIINQEKAAMGIVPDRAMGQATLSNGKNSELLQRI